MFAFDYLLEVCIYLLFEKDLWRDSVYIYCPKHRLVSSRHDCMHSLRTNWPLLCIGPLMSLVQSAATLLWNLMHVNTVDAFQRLLSVAYGLAS